MARVWDAFLTEQDKATLAGKQPRRGGYGDRPAVLLIDLYRAVYGDKPEPILEAIKKWPATCGPAAWEAVPPIQRLLATARELGVPVVHTTGLEGMPGWHAHRDPGNGDDQDRIQIIPEVAPIAGEVVIHKSSPSAFWGTPLAGYLNQLGVDTLLVGGESTSGCVRASVVDGCTYRYRMIVVEECVFDRHQAAHAINLFDLNQKYADVLSLDEVTEWMQDWHTSQKGKSSK